MRLDHNHKGGPLKFFLAFQNPLITYAENLKPSISRTCEINKLEKTRGGGKRGGDKGDENNEL
eukprot:3575734-Ditylum_brightwellii.AAC.1